MKGSFVVVLVAVLVAMATSIPSAPSESEFLPAEQGLIRLGSSGKARCVARSYWLSKFKLTQAQAHEYCREQGLSLLMTRNDAQHQEVYYEYKNYWGYSAPEWIWLNAYKDNATGSEFVYDDQNRLIYYSNFMNNFLNWPLGQCIILLGPDGFNGTNQFKWMFQDCANTGKFICEENYY